MTDLVRDEDPEATSVQDWGFLVQITLAIVQGHTSSQFVSPAHASFSLPTQEVGVIVGSDQDERSHSHNRRFRGSLDQICEACRGTRSPQLSIDANCR